MENSAGDPLRVLVADDNILFRKGLAYVLNDLAPSVEVIEASTYDEVKIICAGDDHLQLIFLDLHIPGLAGENGVEQLTSAVSAAPVVATSMIDDRKSALAALEGGAVGYLPKTLSSSVILSALRLVLAGGVFVPHSLLMPAEYLEGGWPARQQRARPEARSRDLLTPRQLEVLWFLSRGKVNKEIARELNLSVGTVKLHVTALLKALEVNNRTQVVIKAASLGLLDKDWGSSTRKSAFDGEELARGDRRGGMYQP